MAPDFIAPPAVAPVPAGEPRPFWSVMVPFRNRAEFVVAALESVLAQDPGPAEMEIWLVDNSDTAVDLATLLSPSARQRIRYHRQPRLLSMADNWSSCVQLSRGHYVHLLNDDDYVLPGFYRRIGEMARARPDVGLLCCPVDVVDRQGAVRSRSLHWADWREPSHEVISMIDSLENPLRTPSIVVRRATYERVGAFSSALMHYLDWEMWLRAAHADGAWMTCEVLAAYRVHETNETARAQRAGEDLLDFYHCARLLRQTVPGFDPRRIQRHVATLAWERGQGCARAGETPAAAAFHAVWRATATPGLRARKALAQSWQQIALWRMRARMAAGRVVRWFWPGRRRSNRPT